MIAIKDGKLEEVGEVPTSFNYVLQYAGPCAWEGIRSYEQRDGSTQIFKLEEHVARLFDSAKILNFKIPYSRLEVELMIKKLVDELGGGDLYIRPIVYSSINAESAKKVDHDFKVDVYAFPLKTLHDRSKKIKVMISSFKRGYPQYQMQAKTPPNYHFLNTVRHELELAKVDDLLMTDNDGYITEATVANLFIVKNGMVFTPPNNGSILPGITRQTIIEQIKGKSVSLGVKGIQEKRLTRADLYTADQVFICGTYAEIVQIGEVDGREIENQYGVDVIDGLKYIFEVVTRR